MRSQNSPYLLDDEAPIAVADKYQSTRPLLGNIGISGLFWQDAVHALTSSVVRICEHMLPSRLSPSFDRRVCKASLFQYES